MHSLVGPHTCQDWLVVDIALLHEVCMALYLVLAMAGSLHL